jgi:adenylate cyclase
MGSERSGRAWIRPLRLVCGLVLYTYLLTHFSNHALGLVSLDAMAEGRVWFLALWRNPLGTGALYGALVIHWLLGLWLIYRRRTLRMPVWEATQIVLGLAVPPLLAAHVVGTRLAHTMFGTDDPYTRLLLSFWVVNPWAGFRQSMLLLIAWTHGCIGLHFWLRLRPWYRRSFPVILSGWVLVPVLAWLGFAEAGRDVAALARQPGFVARVMAESRVAPAAARARLQNIEVILVRTTWILLAAALLARGGREYLSRRRAVIRLTYSDGRSVVVPLGWTVLEASRSAGIPHASVCGARGRCSTCRIRVTGDPAALPAPSPQEQRVLLRVGAPPNVRLACQLRPEHDLAVTPLLDAAVGAGATLAPMGSRNGEEREIAVLFADLRGFTRLAEHKLPYDVVFFLNRYFEAVGRAIAEAGGMVNQYTGDGVMALFGLGCGPEEASRQALRASGAMIARVQDFGRSFGSELEEPLRLGVGIHTGPAVVGEMGYGETRYLTAVGDTVHVASRLEALTKEYHCDVVVSQQVMSRAGVDDRAYPCHELTVRNRQAPLRIVVVKDARSLASGIPQGEASTRSPR